MNHFDNWDGDQPDARPLHTKTSTERQKHPCLKRDSNRRPQRPSDQGLRLRPRGHWYWSETTFNNSNQESYEKLQNWAPLQEWSECDYWIVSLPFTKIRIIKFSSYELSKMKRIFSSLLVIRMRTGSEQIVTYANKNKVRNVAESMKSVKNVVRCTLCFCERLCVSWQSHDFYHINHG
jgi:hypothetical protein